MRSALPLGACLAAVLLAAPGNAPAQQPPASATPAPSANPAPKPAIPAPPAAATPGKSALAPAAAQVRAASARKKKAKDTPVSGPIASYPGFRMLDGGGSRVLVILSKKVNVTESKAEGKLTYRIHGVHVPTRTNRLPLITTFFATPVSRAELVDRDGDVDLVIALRAATTPQFRVIDTDRGAELQVDFPKPATESAASGDAGSTTSTDTPANRPAAGKSLDNPSENAY